MRVLLATWGCIASAQAATLPTQAEPVLYLEDCTSDPEADCWNRVTPLTRFAAEHRAQIPPVSTDVRLALSDDALLVRVDALPEGYLVEVVVDPGRTDDLSNAQLVRATEGVEQHRLGPIPEPGQTRALRVLLRRASSGDALIWAPEGAGDLTRPAIAVVGPPPAQATPVHVHQTDDTLRIDAKGASSIQITHRRPRLPKGGRGIDPPWSRHVQTGEFFDAPGFIGWYDIELLWRSKTGAVTQIQRRSLYWVPPADERVEKFGLHPAPTRWMALDGEDLVVQGGMSICAEDSTLTDAADWLGTEIRRLTGQNISRSCRGTKPDGGGLWLRKIPEDGPAPAVNGPADWLAQVSPEGFYIETSSTGADVWVHTARAGLYGAQALADLLGMKGRANALAIMDNPAIPWRILFHEVPTQHKGVASPRRYIEFMQRAVARGRINMLVLDLKGAFKYRSHPELSRPEAWTRAGLDKVLTAARVLDIEVIPTLNSPGHVNWITRVHPELAEESTMSLLCTRHPDTRPLLLDLYDELIDAFDSPRFVHIGHDEIRWRTSLKHEAQRCPRCEGSPRWAILADDLLWNHEVLRERGARPMLWSDMLLPQWHGSWGNIHRASKRIPEDLRRDFVVVSWGRLGDTVGNLVPEGFTVVRGSMGYTDWKRKGLEPIARGVAGEALALFYGRPWSTFGGSSSPANLYRYWTNVILAGATAWRPDISDGSIDATMDRLMDHPAYLPAYRAWSSTSQFRPLTPTQSAEARPGFDASLPEQASVHEVQYQINGPHWATSESPIEVLIDGRIKGLSLLQATVFTPDAEAALYRSLKRTEMEDGPPLAIIEVEYANGQVVEVPLHLGLDTARPDRRTRAHTLWRTAGTLRVPSTAAAPLNNQARDRALYRFDWRNPKPRAPILRATIRTTQAGASLVVAGLVAVEAP